MLRPDRTFEQSAHVILTVNCIVAAVLSAAWLTSSFEMKTSREEGSTACPGSLLQHLISASVRNITMQ